MRRLLGNRLGGGGGGGVAVGGIRVIQPGAIIPGFTFTRSQVDSQASAPALQGIILSGANVPRFGAPDGALLMYAQRTNLIRNSLGVGGGPGTPPTHWGSFANWAGAAMTVDAGSADGINYMRLIVNGTASLSNSRFAIESGSIISAIINEYLSHSFYARLVSGSMGTADIRAELWERSGGGAVAGPIISGSGVTLATSDWTRIGITSVLSDPLTDTVQPTIRLGATVGNNYTFTVDIGMPSVVSYGVTPASTILTPTEPAIYPTAGLIQQATAGTDMLTYPTSALGLAGPFTMLANCYIQPPGYTPSGSFIIGPRLQNGTGGFTNGITFRVTRSSGATTVFVNGTLFGTNVGNLTLPGQFKLGLTWDGTTAHYHVNGVGTVTYVPTAAFTYNNLVISGGINYRYLDILPYATPLADLPARVAGMP